MPSIGATYTFVDLSAGLSRIDSPGPRIIGADPEASVWFC